MSVPERGLSEHHRHLDHVFETLVSELECGDPLALRAEWDHFERELLEHLEIEERELLPTLAPRHRDEVDRIRAEHEGIRAALTDLGVRLDLHCLRAEDVADFVEQLRTHAAREDAGVYRWLEEQGPEAGWRTFKDQLRGLASRLPRGLARRPGPSTHPGQR
jgi:hypothetical protein